MFLSTHKNIQTASIGAVCDDTRYDGIKNGRPNGITEHNYCVEYAGSTVQILKGERVWYDDKNRIMIGWHGS